MGKSESASREPRSRSAVLSQYRKPIQLGLVGLALAVATVIVWPRGPREDVTEPSETESFSMLAYLDERVSVQEDEKDVRCWSSFNKLQMFITQCEISDEARATRIEQHMKLVQSIWDDARQEEATDDYIAAAAVESVLKRRFPHVDTNEGVQFDLIADYRPVVIDSEELRDYSDTIEPWRLLQTWATRHLDEQARLTLRPQFSQDALQVLYRFLRAYDLAVLQQARRIAHEKKLSRIDADSLTAAFQGSGAAPQP